MPHPIAHPAAAIPFKRWGLVFSALVIGSLAPDAGYLFQFSDSDFMYSFRGLIIFDLPAGLLLLGLFHALVKLPLLSLLPQSWQSRLTPLARGFSFVPLKQFGLVVASVFIGALSHVVWDGFTHPYGWLAERTSFFLQTLPTGVPLYSVLQNLSTLVGSSLLLIWLIQWYREAPSSDERVPQFILVTPRVFYLFWALSVIALEATIVLMRLTHLLPAGRGSFRYSIFGGIFFALFLTAVEVAIYCIAWTVGFYRPRAVQINR